VAKFLSNAQFLVGLSLDGPEHIHDHYRRYANGQPSWATVVKARDILLDQGVEVNALTVVTDYSAHFAKEIYDFHKAGGLKYMQFIPCCEPDPLDRIQVASYTVNPDAYGSFLCELFDLWLLDFAAGRPTTSIRWFDSLFYTFVDLQPPECTLLPECGTYLVVEHNGDVFSCDFYVEPSWRLGNVISNHLSEMLNSTLQRQFGQRKTQRAKLCGECRWLAHCYGGCPKNRLLDFPSNGSDYYCRAYLQFFEYAGEAFAQLAKQWKSDHGRIVIKPGEMQGRPG